MFVDRVRITVSGGRGGDGCVSFRREKFVPKGGPDGGDGGAGGDVILRATFGEQSLVDRRFQPLWRGANGSHGRGKRQHGACADPRVILVPVGTLVRDGESGEMLADLAEDGQEYTAARGGAAGRGNPRFASARCRVPRGATPGAPGQEFDLDLELKTVADVGLVGYPNAGKSTLLRALSAARPKTAAYPFTTRHPIVGVVEFDDFFRYTVADVPGLIDGAHANVGLGHEFLRHIERCRILVFVLDTAGVDQRQPENDLAALFRELELHQQGLTARPAVVVANKMDMPAAGEGLAALKQHTDLTVFPICAEDGTGTRELAAHLRTVLEAITEPA